MNTTHVTVTRWLKQIGERIQRGEPVIELETEKVTYELESPIAGTLQEIVAQADEEVEVGSTLCYISES